MRRTLIFLMLPAAMAWAPSPAPAAGAAPEANVLLVTVDTLRFDRVSFFGSRKAATPAIDALARESLAFRRAYAHNPVTLPSHANILTGATPLYHGISDNTGFKLDERFLTLAEYLKGRGYRTAAFVGAFPLDSRFGLDQGFDLYDDYYGTHNEREFFFVERPAEKVVAPAMDWIGRQRGKWFAWVHVFDPHQPYLPPPPFREKYADDPYSGEVAYADAQLGRLFAFLKERGLWQRTIVVLTADHGEALGEKGEDTHSYFAYDNTIHVPLLVRIPARAPATSAVTACHADIFPTVCAALAQKAPAGLQGESLLEVAAAGKRRAPEIYFESLTAWLNRDWAPLRGFISGGTKFIDLPIKEVYDLEKDPDEERNLAASAPIGRLKDALNRLMRRLRSPVAAQREKRLDPETLKRLRSLGYVAESGPARRSRTYGEPDDLKVLLPLQGKLLDAVGRFQSRDFAAAEKMLREVIAASPGFILAYTHLASMFKETGRPADAVAVLEKGLERNPGNIYILSKLGIVLADSGGWKRAIPILEECVAREDFDPERFNFLGIAYYHGGDYAKALKNYQRALELDRNNAAVFSNIGGVHLALAARDKKPQAIADAEASFRQALAIDPRLASALNGLAIVCKKTGRNGEAIDNWRRALAADPDYELAMINLGIVLLEEGRPGEALERFQEYRDKFFSRLPAAERARVDRLIAEARAGLH